MICWRRGYSRRLRPAGPASRLGYPDLDGISRVLGGVEVRVTMPPKIAVSWPVKAVWYVLQTAIVAWVMWIDYSTGDPRPGIALILGIGWALSATVLLSLGLNGLRRFSRGLRSIVRHKISRERLTPSGRLCLSETAEQSRRPRIGNDPR